MSERIEIKDWVDATRCGVSCTMRCTDCAKIEPSPWKTQPSMMSPHLLAFEDTDDLHTRIEQALEEIQA